MISQAKYARLFFNRLRLPLIALAATAALFAFAACGTGDTGPQGLQGEPGVPGVPGSPGEPGNAGASGSSGATGETGPTGTTGSGGSTGDAGSSGAAGLTGASTGATLIVPIAALDDSGQDGIARLTARGLQTEVVIEINSGAADVAQPIHVHAGSCETLGGVDYALDSVLNGFSSTIIDVSLPALREGLSAINLHKSGAEVGTYVACGNIPAAGTTVTISLNPLNDSGQAGTATLIAAGDTTWVVVNVGADPLGVSQPIHIHSGSCADLGGVETGLTTLENGRSITMIDSPIASFLTSDTGDSSAYPLSMQFWPGGRIYGFFDSQPLCYRQQRRFKIRVEVRHERLKQIEYDRPHATDLLCSDPAQTAKYPGTGPQPLIIAAATSRMSADGICR